MALLQIYRALLRICRVVTFEYLDGSASCVIYRAFSDIQGSFADIQGSFADM